MLLAGVIVLAVAQCTLWLLDALLSWEFRGLLLDSASDQVAFNARFAIAIVVGAAINLIALAAFLLRRQGPGELVLTAVQVGNLLFSIYAAISVSAAWLLLGAAPAVATFVLLVLRRRMGAARSSATV